MRALAATVSLLFCAFHWAQCRGYSWLSSREVFLMHFDPVTVDMHFAFKRRIIAPLAALALQSMGAPHVLSYYILGAVALYGALRCVGAVARHFGAAEEHGMAALILFLGVHYMRLEWAGVFFYGYPFWADLTAPFFISALLYLIICRPDYWRAAWAVLFVVATLNRETTLVLLPLALLLDIRIGVASGVAWGVVKAALVALIPGAVGGNEQASQNIVWLMSFEPSHWVFFLAVYVAGGIVFPSPIKTKVGAGLLLGALFHAVCIFRFGSLQELRAFNDIAPIAAAGWAATLARRKCRAAVAADRLA